MAAPPGAAIAPRARTNRAGNAAMLLLVATLVALPARGESLRVGSSDANGITLRLDIGAWAPPA